MQHAKQIGLGLQSIVFAVLLVLSVAGPAFAKGVEPTHPRIVQPARPPHQDPTPPPPPPPPDDGGGTQNIFQNITQLINFPFPSLVEALQNAIESILRAALEPIQAMFEAVLSLWLENPGILSSGNAALPGWDLMKDAWQFMYSIAIAFWPLTLAVVAAIAAKDAVAASTWGLGDLKSALGTWFTAVLLSATSLWWMDLANNLANAITSYILYNFAGPQFFPGTFMVFFTTVLPGLFLAFPLAGIIIILFLVILAITIFVGLTFGIIARLVLMYLLVALGPLAIILGVLPPLRFVTQMWVRGFLLVLALGPVDALLLKLAFNVAQYASSAPPVQAAAAFIGVFGLLSILITINFTVVKGVFGAVIAVANQTMSAVKTVGQMVVAGALLMTGAGAGAGAALGGSTAAGAGSGGIGGGGAGGGGAASALGGASGGTGSANTGGGIASSRTGFGNNNGAKGSNGNSHWRPSARGMAAAGNYLQSTRGPLAGFGALLRAAGVDQMQHERGGIGSGVGTGTTAVGSPGLENGDGVLQAANPALTQRDGTQGIDDDAAAVDGYGEMESEGRADGTSLAGIQAQLTGRDAVEREQPPALEGTGHSRPIVPGTRPADVAATAAQGRAQALTQPTASTTSARVVSAAVQASRARTAAGSVAGSAGQNLASSRTGTSPRGRGGSGATTDSARSQKAGADTLARLDTSSGMGGDATTLPATTSRRPASERTNLGVGQETSAPPRRANPAAIEESRAAMGFDSGADVGANPNALAGATRSGDEESGNGIDAIDRESATVAAGTSLLGGENADSVAQNAGAVGGEGISGAVDEGGAIRDDYADMIGGETMRGTSDASVESVNSASELARQHMPLLAPEADRTLSMLPEGSDEARWQAAQLVSSYSSEGEQMQTAMALEQAMHTANEQNGMAWSQMGTAMEHGLWSTREAANNGIGLGDMARQMEPFTGSRDPADYLAWQIAGHGDQFQLPSQQVAYLPAPGPYDYQAGHYVEQQLGMAISHQDAAQVFYVIRDPSTPGGGWSKAQAFVGEVNRISRDKAGEPLIELDRWMQTNAPTRARLLWNMHFRLADGK